tara:strand:- start:94 stop:501 length:408 start_codon:yes stop_codon:yes gene_type:complete
VEFAAELSDFVNEDILLLFPKLEREDVTITVIQSADHILNTYDKKISEYTAKSFKRQNINVQVVILFYYPIPFHIRVLFLESFGLAIVSIYAMIYRHMNMNITIHSEIINILSRRFIADKQKSESSGEGDRRSIR